MQLPRELALCVQTGREENLELVCATQLPHKVNASITGQSTELVCFRLDERLALGYVQDCAPRILYDLHQFMGAMGLTLEHPLYRWSYRVKLLLSALGGASQHLLKLGQILANEPV